VTRRRIYKEETEADKEVQEKDSKKLEYVSDFESKKES
jgi:hypothetical protein